MPAVPRTRARRSFITAAPATSLLIACLLAACSDPPSRPEADLAHGAAEAAVDQAPPRLSCLPAALVSLQLPLREGLAFAHPDPGTSEAVAQCVLSLFGTRTLKSPLAFDRAYGRVFAEHEEGGTLDLRGIAPSQLRLFRIGSTPTVDVWLLRAGTGTELEPAHIDILFSTRRADGALVDQLLVGAIGMLYRRDYDIETARTFAIHEDTGHGAAPGPGYRARYRLDDAGRFALVAGQVLPAPREPAGSTAASAGTDPP
ncbi:hypothetical protein [Luteimonas sp. SDU82]|uniref:hypothetical protein n=1 Tax=Luteimonas sp. SDU82 TaxID=3422592 RepID=UPI003EB6E304